MPFSSFMERGLVISLVVLGVLLVSVGVFSLSESGVTGESILDRLTRILASSSSGSGSSENPYGSSTTTVLQVQDKTNVFPRTDINIGVDKRGKARRLSKEILTLSEEYGRSGGRQRTNLREDLILKAKQRADLMEVIAEEDPGEFLKNAFLASEKSKLIPEIQQYLEKEVLVENAVLDSRHIDDFDQPENSKFEYRLIKGKNVYNFFPDEKLIAVSGDEINVNGLLLGNNLVVDAGQKRRGVPATAVGIQKKRRRDPIVDDINPYGKNDDPPTEQSPTLGPQKIAVLLLKSYGETDLPSKEDMEERIFRGPIQDFFKENSYDKMWLEGEVFGWYEIENFDGIIEKGEPKDYINAALEADESLDLRGFERIVLVPTQHKNHRGWGSVGKVGITTDKYGHLSVSYAMVSAASLDENTFIENSWTDFDHVFTHEFGHNLGVHHANSFECENTISTGYCKHDEYGNRFDVMGSGGKGDFNAYFKHVFDWISIESGSVKELSQTGDKVALEPIDKEGSVVAVLKKEGENSPLIYLETRTNLILSPWESGEDINLEEKGIFVNWVFNELETRILNLKNQPGRVNWRKVSLPPGEEFFDERSGTHIMHEIGSNEANVVSIRNEKPSCDGGFIIRELGFWNFDSGGKQETWKGNEDRSISLKQTEIGSLEVFTSSNDYYYLCPDHSYNFKLEMPIEWEFEGIINPWDGKEIENVGFSFHIPEDQQPGKYDLKLLIEELDTGIIIEKIIEINVIKNEDLILKNDFGNLKYGSSGKGGSVFLPDNSGTWSELGLYSHSVDVTVNVYENLISENIFQERLISNLDPEKTTVLDNGITCKIDRETFEHKCLWYNSNKLITVHWWSMEDLELREEVSEDFFNLIGAYVKKYPPPIVENDQGVLNNILKLFN